MAKKAEPQDVWEYADWLRKSNRLTIEEYNKLHGFLFQLEDEVTEELSSLF